MFDVSGCPATADLAVAHRGYSSLDPQVPSDDMERHARASPVENRYTVVPVNRSFTASRHRIDQWLVADGILARNAQKTSLTTSFVSFL
jgi:hypothetical protein